jgi:hypothetical protein
MGTLHVSPRDTPAASAPGYGYTYQIARRKANRRICGPFTPGGGAQVARASRAG